MIIIRILMRTRAALLIALVLAVPGCGSADPQDDRLDVVASFYPLAFLAEEIGGLRVRVVDLTPPGTEAHDVELSFRGRVQVEDADLVLHLGSVGFQPQVEAAVAEATGTVLALGTSGEDPHVWLAPRRMRTIAENLAAGMEERDPAGGYRERLQDLLGALDQLDTAYRAALGSCQTRTMVVSHSAFGHLAAAYGLQQVGVAGISPEGEPTAAPLEAVAELVRSGEARAIFHEETDEGRRIAEPVARDLHVPLLPLSTLESEPREGDYLTAMGANLASLREGLGCR